MRRLFLILVILMSAWQFTEVEATTNLDDNPSFELNVDSLTAANGAAIAQSSAEQAIGLYSAKVTPTANTDDGVYRDYTLVADTDYTFSFSIKGVNGIPYEVYFYDNTAGSRLGTAVEFTGDGTWRRQVVTVTNGSNTDISVYVVKNNDASTEPFYLDAFQLEALDHATTYGDGEQDGWYWTAGPHASTSIRDSQSAEGGQVLDFDGADYDFDIADAIGVGMPPVEQVESQPAQGDGADHQRTLARSRVFQLAGSIVGADREDYLKNRLRLERVLSRDRVKDDQDIPIRYRLGQNNITISARYAGGLEKNATRGSSVEKIGVRFKAEQPFWKAAMGVANGDNGAVGIQGQGVLSMTGQISVSNANYILQRDADGLWAEMDGGLSLSTPSVANAAIYAVAQGPDGAIYVGGAFTNLGGVANADYIAKWDGTAWSALGTGMDAAVRSLKFGPDNTLYAGGDFTSAGGVANTDGVAKWNGSAWSALDTGLDNGTIFNNDGILVASDGSVYITGSFTSVSGVANTAYIAKWNGSAWSAMGTGLQNTGFALVERLSTGDIYVGGSFANAGGVANTQNLAYWDGSWNSATSATLNSILTMTMSPDSTILYVGGANDPQVSGMSDTSYVAQLTISGDTWTDLDSGTNGTVRMIETDPTGDFIYAGGDFTSAGGVSNTAYIAKWNVSDSDWDAMGTGTNGIVYTLTIANNGLPYVAGNFSSAGGVSDTNYLARWTGVAWQTIALAIKNIYQATDGKIWAAGGYINAGGVANADRISYYDPTDESWHAVGTGADGLVHAIAEAPNGDIYIVGSFTSVNGVANTAGIAYWDGSSWNACSTGLNGTGLALAFAPNGDLYVAGLFQDAAGVSNTQNIAMWDGSNFNALSDEPNSAVNALVFDPNGKIYLGGAFTQIGSTDYDYIAYYDPTTDTFSALENGSNGYVNDLAIAPSGNLIMVGTFTQAGSISADYIASWNGNQFSNFGSGLNNVAYVVAVDDDGQIYVGGVFTEAGEVSLPDKAALWTGTTWTALDVDLPGTAAVEAIEVTTTAMYLGFDTSGTAIAAGVDTATYQGDAPGYPVFKAAGPGRLYQLVNITSGHEIYFDIELEDGEVVTLDLRPGHKTFSSTFRGLIPQAILEGSETETFQLLPGENDISCLIDDASAEAHMLWDEYFQGFEAVVYLPIVSN